MSLTNQPIRIGVANVPRESVEVHPMGTPQSPIFYMKYNYSGTNSVYWDLMERKDFEFN